MWYRARVENLCQDGKVRVCSSSTVVSFPLLFVLLLPLSLPLLLIPLLLPLLKMQVEKESKSVGLKKEYAMNQAR